MVCFSRSAALLVATACAAFSFPVALALDTAQDVCRFPMSNMYVPDDRQKQFPVGFLGCVDVVDVTLPRCDDCACREVQSFKNGGNVISWGVCVEGRNATSCTNVGSEPTRTYCGAEAKPTEPTTSPPPTSVPPATTPAPEFQPGKVQLPDVSGDTGVSQVAMDAGGGFASTSSSNASGNASSTPMILAIVGAVAAVAAIAAFAIVRARGDEDELNTPKEDNFAVYKDNKPSKRPAKQLPASQFHGRPLQPKQLQPPRYAQPVAQVPVHKYERSDTPEDDRVGDLEAQGYRNHSFISEINMETTRSMVADMDDEYEYDPRRDSHVTVDDDEEENEDEDFDIMATNDSVLDSEYWRDSNNSMLFSNSSALSYYEDEDEERGKSISF